MNIRRIIREEINDFDWAENHIEVGKCFKKLSSNYRKEGGWLIDEPNENYTVKIIDIKQGKELHNKGKWIDIPKGSFDERAVIIKFARPEMKRTGYTNWTGDIELYYSNVQEWLNDGWLVPTECE